MHQSLPKALTPELLADWIVKNCKEKFTEVQKFYYNEEELADLKDKVVSYGIEITQLTKLKKKVGQMIEKGTQGHADFEVPHTEGIKRLKAEREVLENQIDTGYYEDTIKIYGIPNQDTRMMDFFDIEGNEIPERSRQLSAREIREYISQSIIQFESKQA